MADKNSLSDYLAELAVDVSNMQEFLSKLSLMLSTSSDSVSVNQTLQDGSSKTFTVPSFAYLTNKINAVDNKFNSLLTGNGNEIGVVDENGKTKTFELKDISQAISDLDSAATKSLTRPATFKYKNNWFFESFLNPLLYVDIPVDNISTSVDIDKFEIGRVIITSTNQDNLDYFDESYKDQDDILYSSLIEDLEARSISYFEDTNEVELPPSQNKVTGSFDILRILEDKEAKVVLNETQTLTVAKYVLNTLRYYEQSADSPNGVVQRLLQAGDYLVTPDNSEYVIKNVDTDSTSVILQRIFGLGELSSGSNKLRIKPSLETLKYAPVNIGFNERQVIFVKPISSRLKVKTQTYTYGFGFYSNELTITLNTGETYTLADFYEQFVSDFSLVFLNYTKEKKVPKALGEKPNAITLSSDQFKVVQVDKHIQSANDIETVKQNIASVEAIKSQINEVDKQISEKRASLNTKTTLTDSEKLKLNKDLKTLGDTRKTLTTSQASKISSVTTAVKSTPTLIKAPTYRVKGMWSIPEAKETTNGKQYPAQFKVSWRVLNKTGTSEEAEQLKFTDTRGNTVTGAFSPWKEVLTKPRQKEYNSSKGIYEWKREDVSDTEVVNTNQIELPIYRGEVLEIKVKTLSEAGWPDDPVESDWSNSITVEFPADMQTIEDITIISQQAFAEEAKINFQEDLNAKGLDAHLNTAFTNKDKYFPHKAEDIASGFFSTDGSIVDMYTKLKNISDTIDAIQTSIASGTGELKVSIIDQLGNSIEVNNGQTTELFAGYYKDLIKKTSNNITSYDHGKVITNQYILQVENTSQTTLELIAALNGGIGQRATVSDPGVYSDDGYHSNLRYDLAPLTINSGTYGTPGSLQQLDGYQSSQVKGQILYRRSRSIGLSENLVAGDLLDGDLDESTTIYDNAYDTDYSYNGVVIGNTKLPYSAGHYLPYDPTLNALTIKVNSVDYSMSSNAAVWNGNLSSSAPEGGGLLSEFCISTDHPDIQEGGKYNLEWSSLYRPAISATEQPALPFSQAIHCEISKEESTNAFGAKYFTQAAYKKPDENYSTPYEYKYPIKQGFSANDQYLIGKYTCGAYLYISPNSYESIAATAYAPTESKRLVKYGEENALQIPLTFQYRCSDYLSYVGGYRANLTAGLRNIKYTKRAGFDIKLKNETFSFDVLVSAQYEKETAVITPISNVSSSSMSQITLTD